MLNKPEILAPAGSMEALRAAVNAGADACYVGGSLFSARAFAGNFDTTELLEAIDYCHINHVRLYMAVNTLLKNSELDMLLQYVEPFYIGGIDGIIVQDMGVVSCIRKHFPDMNLHGSTQMSVSSCFGAEFLKNLGLTRFVPSREISIKEIKSIIEKVDIEVEAFVHGAMCFAYSGKCLLSSFAGGRSGNRGRCAQPCRKAYQCAICDDAFKEGPSFTKAAYNMSMKDMCTLNMVPELVDAGISSFKIEGRMKKPEYVAATVSAYQEVTNAYLDGDLTDKLITYHMERLSDIYNRGGFHSGYYHMHNGREMLSGNRPNHSGTEIGKVVEICPPDIKISLYKKVNEQDVVEIRGSGNAVELTSPVSGESGQKIVLKGKNFKNIAVNAPVYRIRNNKLIGDIYNQLIEKEKIQEVYGIFSAHIGHPACLTLYSTYNDASAVVYGEIVCKADKHPVTGEQILQKLNKTGNSGVRLYLETDMDDNIFMSIGSLGALRRQGIEALKQNMCKLYKREAVTVEKLPAQKGRMYLNSLSGCTVSVKTKEQFRIINNYKFVDNIIIDYNFFREVEKTGSFDGKRIILSFPDICREKNISLMKELMFLAGACDGIMIKNIDELAMLVKYSYHGMVVCDSFLYAYNQEAVDFYMDFFDNICIIGSVELTIAEKRELSCPVVEKIYGYQPVMITAQCFLNHVFSECGYNQTRNIMLKDEQNNIFYAVNYCRHCYSVIYNGVATNNIYSFLTGEVPKDGGKADFLVEFTIEKEKDVKEVMEYIEGLLCKKSEADVEKTWEHFTRGHYYKGIE